ncbi:DUF4352 domain-containing protein [Clostridium sporogenes]|uniref:DUF4352 domain-containing protein n=1 Tax=Clostridium sporogenes TaxID=1509 RepID=UPI00024BA64B|nr:DUF4352 domain-containing protein [Clostridium sporogenes]EHN16989.1 hypothetical protein IYC_00827 [Clostridium sporogenes PA 3679]NFQ34306.1 DUF4352 domain-containing protein [Clostridium sporogenes]NFQ60083.1 DUF4352 domain-containing protein [Clostridium sporogenes]NFU10771.1 DUF4352 domain-containing protein [Clostridium sporogenes]NFU43146.1 DUF4352 domain-containing protein [Clostridium sporogenes]
MGEKVKKPFYKKIWFWVLAVIVVGGIVGVNQDKPKKVGQTNAKVETKKEETKSKTFKVGDVVELKDLKVTVNKVYTVAGDDFNKPKDGNEYIAADITLENTGKEEKPVSSVAMFKVVDKDGRQCEYSVMGLTAAKAGQMDGTLGAGRKMTGAYVVEVPKGTTGLELEFDSSLLSGGQVIVKLN